MNAGDAVPVLTQNLAEERAMADWIRANTPAMITQLYPEIQSSIVLPAGEEGRETVTEEGVITASSQQKAKERRLQWILRLQQAGRKSYPNLVFNYKVYR